MPTELYAKIFLLSLKTFIFFTRCQCSELFEYPYSDIDEPFPVETCTSLLHNCTCHDYDKTIGVICSYVQDFNEFNAVLRNVSFRNVSYEITLTQARNLPAHCFTGLSIYRLYLDDKELIDIKRDIFDGVLKLKKLNILRSSIQEIPDFSSIESSLYDLHLDNSYLTALDGNRLQNFTLIDSLSFANNFISYVDPNVFKGTGNVITFDISFNELTFLPSNLLENWKRLKKIVLSHNQLLHVNNIFSCIHPKIIYLDYNNLTNVDAIFHPNMLNVTTIYLANNPINRISNTSFNGKISNVHFLYLDHCMIRQFDAECYQELSELKELDLSWNRIEKVSEQLVDFGNSFEFNLAGNQIQEFEAELSHTVIRFFLHDNKLSALGKTLWYSQITRISVARNHLQYLSEDDFKGMHATTNIELQGNQIQRIDKYTFFFIRKDISYLDLSSNYIRILNGSLRFLSQLVAVNLSENFIQSFQEDEFTGLLELSDLYLHRNNLFSLGMQLQQLPQLQLLDIRSNDLETLARNQIPKTLRFIHLKGNPFRCDCKLLSFLQWLNKSGSPGSDVLPCALYGENRNYSRSIKPCPEPCSCSCTEDGEKHFMYLDCSSRNMSVLPKFLTSKENNTNEDLQPLSAILSHRFDFEICSDSQFWIHDHALGVSLENNSIHSLDYILVHPKIKQLQFAGNRLKVISTTFLYSLKKLHSVTLSGNPWTCDCDTIPLRKWLLSKLNIVQDINKTVCDIDGTKKPHLNGKVIWTLNDLDLCPTDIAVYFILFSVLIFLLLCTGGIILYMRYQIPIKVWLYAHGFSIVKEEDLDKDKIFDAFLSYANDDVDLMFDIIVPAIERNQPETKLCVHGRDFIPGFTIEQNICCAVRYSKKTVVFLSENYLNSDWCLYEFRKAFEKTLEDKINRIIIIKMGNLPEQMPENIRNHLQTTTYLTWEDDYFWQNFYFVLPTSKKRENMRSKKQGHMELEELLECQVPLIA